MERSLRTHIALTARMVAAAAVALLALGAIAARAASVPHAMVVAESAPAAKAGLAVMRRGGNAVDAAVAAALAMGVTNPASCGIGGGGFMLIYWAKTGRFYALDYRERAPLRASANMYLRNGRPDEALARTGPLAVAVPGEVAGLAAALKRFGSRDFQTLAAPAIRLAESGFPVTPHLAWEISRTADIIRHDPGLSATFFDRGGNPLKAGDVLTEKRLAGTLRNLGKDPDKNFYRGKTGLELASFIQRQGGLVSPEDLASYRPVWRTPLRFPFAECEVYALPPPASGGVLLEMLGMLEKGHLPGLGFNSVPYLVRLIGVMRQGFIDRQQYGDPAFVKVPVKELLSPEHIKEARALALKRTPAPLKTAAHDHGTANLLVVDSAGNAVAMTTTINTIFGAKMMEPRLGIVLNDEMDDFAVATGVRNVYRLAGVKPNAIAPGKRPLSSMTPIIVTKNGRFVMAAGGSGGPTIITGVLQVALDLLEFHMTPARAVSEPRIHDQANPDVVLVEERLPVSTRNLLERMGYRLKVWPELGAVGAIMAGPEGLRGAFDSRKGGGADGF